MTRTYRFPRTGQEREAARKNFMRQTISTTTDASQAEAAHPVKALSIAPDSPSYRSRPTRARRRSKAQIDAVRGDLYSIVKSCKPATCRQVFYRAASQGIGPKSEGAYKNTIIRLLGLMRIEVQLPLGWIAASTRWMRKPSTFCGLRACLQHTTDLYRRSLWNDQNAYVEIWAAIGTTRVVLLKRSWHEPSVVWTAVVREYKEACAVHTVLSRHYAIDRQDGESERRRAPVRRQHSHRNIRRRRSPGDTPTPTNLNQARAFHELERRHRCPTRTS